MLIILFLFGLQHRSPMADSSDYSLIVDESMMVGSQKLMLSLAIPSHKQTGIAFKKNKPMFLACLYQIDGMEKK